MLSRELQTATRSRRISRSSLAHDWRAAVESRLPCRIARRDRRVRTAWNGAELISITLHERRHTFASFMIAAGVNAKALSIYMGHSSITITQDRHGHLMPGSETEAARLLDDYLDGAARTK
jgi:integrase